MEKIIIIGASGHGKVVADAVENQKKYCIAGFVDKNYADREMAGYNILGKEEDLPQLTKQYKVNYVIIAVGDNYLRSRIAFYVEKLCPKLSFATVIHPNAVIAETSMIAEGTVITAGAIVNPHCTIGRFALLYSNASLEHDSSMEAFSSLAPRTATGGNCTIGPYSAIGIGAVLCHNITIGEHTVIGAGSTVIQNIDAYCVAYGTPARKIRSRKAGDKYL